jgi:hypothetical protein
MSFVNKAMREREREGERKRESALYHCVVLVYRIQCKVIHLRMDMKRKSV